MNSPVVTIICICYNQAKFVEQALDSVIGQTYKSIELLVIDDGSTDGSVKIIKNWISKHPETTLLMNPTNVGYCKTFNKAFGISTGSYCIDLAADDILLPGRVQEGLKSLTEAGTEYGVTFSDAEHVDERGNLIRLHSHKYPHKTIPNGDIYCSVIDRYFICSPTMMFRREVVEYLNGYDESLAFEDFDFWVRASRKFKFIYSPAVLLKKRSVSDSMSKSQFKRSGAQRWSTYKVCEKIKELNRVPEENDALKRRLRYELKLSLRMIDLKLAGAYLRLLLELKQS
ncbi:MAG: glycosyltransferase [Cyclobacteriaceae bacterium]|nr:glycosyltransferase [Cyclobacteriaceae bacterium]